MTDVEVYEPVPAGRDGQPTAEQLVFRWLTTKRTANTRFAYGRDLGVRILRPGATEIGEPGPSKAPDWLTYCRSIGLDPLHGVQEEHVALWARGMEAAGLSAPTVARKLCAVSSWYTWLRKHGHVPDNPAEDLDRPDVDPDSSKTPGLTKDQALAHARRSRHGTVAAGGAERRAHRAAAVHRSPRQRGRARRPWPTSGWTAATACSG